MQFTGFAFSNAAFRVECRCLVAFWWKRLIVIARRVTSSPGFFLHGHIVATLHGGINLDSRFFVATIRVCQRQDDHRKKSRIASRVLFGLE